MRRGTSAYINYTNLNFNILESKNWSITIKSEDGCTEIKKVKGQEVAIVENAVSVKLSPKETLMFNAGEIVNVQLKAMVNEDTGATPITQKPIEEILDEEPFEVIA